MVFLIYLSQNNATVQKSSDYVTLNVNWQAYYVVMGPDELSGVRGVYNPAVSYLDRLALLV